MTDDLVKRLRSWLKQRTVLDTKDPIVKKTLQQLADRIGEQNEVLEILRSDIASIRNEADKRIEELQSNIKDYLEGNYPHPRTYRPDQCPHDKYYYEDCHDCDFEYWKSKGFE